MAQIHGWGQSLRDKARRANLSGNKLDNWVKTCLRVNKELDNRKRKGLKMTGPEALVNLDKVIEILRAQGVEHKLIESVELGRNALVAIEMLGIAAATKSVEDKAPNICPHCEENLLTKLVIWQSHHIFRKEPVGIEVDSVKEAVDRCMGLYAQNGEKTYGFCEPNGHNPCVVRPNGQWLLTV